MLIPEATLRRDTCEQSTPATYWQAAWHHTESLQALNVSEQPYSSLTEAVRALFLAGCATTCTLRHHEETRCDRAGFVNFDCAQASVSRMSFESKMYKIRKQAGRLVPPPNVLRADTSCKPLLLRYQLSSRCRARDCYPTSCVHIHHFTSQSGMKENLSVYPGVHGAQEVVDIDEYSRTTRSCHKKLEVR